MVFDIPVTRWQTDAVTFTSVASFSFGGNGSQGAFLWIRRLSLQQTVGLGTNLCELRRVFGGVPLAFGTFAIVGANAPQLILENIILGEQVGGRLQTAVAGITVQGFITWGFGAAGI